MTDQIIQIKNNDGSISEITLHKDWLKEQLLTLWDEASFNYPTLPEQIAMTMAIATLFFQNNRDEVWEFAYQHHDQFNPVTVRYIDDMFGDNFAMLSDMNDHLLENWRSKTSGKWERRFCDLVYFN